MERRVEVGTAKTKDGMTCSIQLGATVACRRAIYKSSMHKRLVARSVREIEPARVENAIGSCLRSSGKTRWRSVGTVYPRYPQLVAVFVEKARSGRDINELA
ncbi:hypothetical protein RSO01_25300 [Reyranella soli]|uniref:Uncharacterized protein n=1 Tax=Reyranella soli TaxID=1230389 RepID=A0A512N8Q9_9HYPH|nr:hypothetical protein RSO01_25300 [Reyranella soli]